MSKHLKKYLEDCKTAYYAGEPIISDDQYDHLEEICSEDLSVGTNKGRVKHWNRLYSLQKVYVGEDPPFDKISMSITPKLDGAAVALYYIYGELLSVVTRGNGEYGEDVTHLFTEDTCTGKYIPFRIDTKYPLQVNGEIVAPKYIENARNYAAGALNLKDWGDLYVKDVQFYAYSVKPYPTDFYNTDMDHLNSLGFSTIWREEDFSDYPIDGQVHRVLDNKRYEEMGYTSKHPRGAYAVKERSEGIKTEILDVIWDVGKSGKVTPVAILKPINIDGATVSRATLNNVGFIEALGVQIGDSVMVERAGGIIPRIIRKAE